MYIFVLFFGVAYVTDVIVLAIMNLILLLLTHIGLD